MRLCSSIPLGFKYHPKRNQNDIKVSLCDKLTQILSTYLPFMSINFKLRDSKTDINKACIYLIKINDYVFREMMNINKEFRGLKRKASKKAKEMKKSSLAKSRLKAAVNAIRFSNRLKMDSPSGSEEEQLMKDKDAQAIDSPYGSEDEQAGTLSYGDMFSQPYSLSESEGGKLQIDEQTECLSRFDGSQPQPDEPTESMSRSEGSQYQPNEPTESLSGSEGSHPQVDGQTEFLSRSEGSQPQVDGQTGSLSRSEGSQPQVDGQTDSLSGSEGMAEEGELLDGESTYTPNEITSPTAAGILI